MLVNAAVLFSDSTYFVFRRMVFVFDFNEFFAAALLTGLEGLVADLESFFNARFGGRGRTAADPALAVTPTIDAILPAAFPIVFAAAINMSSTVVLFVSFFFGI
jgi:hypothetical protein